MLLLMPGFGLMLCEMLDNNNNHIRIPENGPIVEDIAVVEAIREEIDNRNHRLNSFLFVGYCSIHVQFVICCRTQY